MSYKRFAIWIWIWYDVPQLMSVTNTAMEKSSFNSGVKRVRDSESLIDRMGEWHFRSVNTSLQKRVKQGLFNQVGWNRGRYCSRPYVWKSGIVARAFLYLQVVLRFKLEGDF